MGDTPPGFGNEFLEELSAKVKYLNTQAKYINVLKTKTARLNYYKDNFKLSIKE